MKVSAVAFLFLGLNAEMAGGWTDLGGSFGAKLKF
jgi:hypothetical protein